MKTTNQDQVAFIAALALAIWEDSGFKLTYAQAKAQAIAMGRKIEG
jgi:hypothetical protein